MKVIYVDDEKNLLENFRLTIEGMEGIEELQLFSSSKTALDHAKNHEINLAFLDVEMPVMNGITLAKELKCLDENIQIVFVTAFSDYALDAFGVQAIGYLLKPYEREDILRTVQLAARIRPIPKKKIVIETFPDLKITVDDTVVRLGHTKQEELMALLVDRGDVGITANDAIDCLWEGVISSDSKFRVTYSRLKEMLKEYGIEHILVSSGNEKYLRTEQVECDLYRMLDGDKEAMAKYNGSYLRRFYWAEERNAQLLQMKNAQE